MPYGNGSQTILNPFEDSDLDPSCSSYDTTYHNRLSVGPPL